MTSSNVRSLKVFLLGNNKNSSSFYNYIKQAYALSVPKKHFIINEPDEADIILFVDVEASNYFKSLREHPLVKRMLEKCYVYTETDTVIPFLPGVFTSAESSCINLKRVRNYCYLSRYSYSKNKFIAPKNENKEYLFSFLGGSTSLVRKRLYNIDFKEENLLIEDTTHYQHWNCNQVNRELLQKRYVDVCAKSSFVLCPRGAGCGSIRLFEMMEMGIAPVLVSDNYLLPKGPNWEEFVVFIKEKDIKKIPSLLKERESDAGKMGELARKAWEEWFAPDKQFNSIVDACLDIKESKIVSESTYRLCWSFLIIKAFAWTCIRKYLRKLVLSTFKVLRIKFPYKLTRV